MRFLADHNLNGWGAEESLSLDVPSGARQDGVAGGCQRGEIRNRGAGDEGAAGSSGQAENVEQPV